MVLMLEEEKEQGVPSISLSDVVVAALGEGYCGVVWRTLIFLHHITFRLQHFSLEVIDFQDE